jgi:hypothetical protein
MNINDITISQPGELFIPDDEIKPGEAYSLRISIGGSLLIGRTTRSSNLIEMPGKIKVNIEYNELLKLKQYEPMLEYNLFCLSNGKDICKGKVLLAADALEIKEVKPETEEA